MTEQTIDQAPFAEPVEATLERRTFDETSRERAGAHPHAPRGIRAPRLHAGRARLAAVARTRRRDELTERHYEGLVDRSRAKSDYFRLLVRDPEILRARTLTDKDIFYNATDGLPRAERELAAAATSRFNGCIFCASVHARFATHHSKRHDDVQRLLDEGIEAVQDAAWHAIIDAAVALTATPSRWRRARRRAARRGPRRPRDRRRHPRRRSSTGRTGSCCRSASPKARRRPAQRREPSAVSPPTPPLMQFWHQWRSLRDLGTLNFAAGAWLAW